MSEKIERQDAFSDELLGYIIIANVKGIEVSQPDLDAILATLHFPKYRLDLPDKGTILKRAMKKWMLEMTSTDVGRYVLGMEEETKVLVRDIVKNKKKTEKDILGMAVIAEESDLQQWGLNYLTNIRVFYLEKEDKLAITTDKYCVNPEYIHMNDQELSLLNKLLPHWEYYQDIYTSSDISRLVRYMIHGMNPCLIKEKAGNYFIPLKFVDLLQELKDLIEDILPAAKGQEELRAKSSLFVSPYFNKDRTRKQLEDVAYTSLQSEIDSYQKELGKILENVGKPIVDKDGNEKVKKNGESRVGMVRKNTVLQKLQEYEEMKTKINFYHMQIGLRQEHLMKQLEELKSLATNLLIVPVEA